MSWFLLGVITFYFIYLFKPALGRICFGKQQQQQQQQKLSYSQVVNISSVIATIIYFAHQSNFEFRKQCPKIPVLFNQFIEKIRLKWTIREPDISKRPPVWRLLPLLLNEPHLFYSRTICSPLTRFRVCK